MGRAKRAKKIDRRGRPPKPMPERIDATPEEIARRGLTAPVPQEWKYLQDPQHET